MKKIFLMLLICIPLSGCYDMTEIEDIESVFAIYVENEGITYCTVTPGNEDKNYGAKIIKTDCINPNDGLNRISRENGKDVSVAHLGQIIFSKDCSAERIKEICDYVLAENEFHPKIMTAFSDVSAEDFINKISAQGNEAVYKKLKNFFNDKYAAVTKCSVTELNRATNHETLGANVPFVTIGENNQPTFAGLMHVCKDRIKHIDKSLWNTIALLENNHKEIYYQLKDTSTAVKLTGGKVKYYKENNHIDIYLEIYVSDNSVYENESRIEFIKTKINSDIIKILNEKNNGYDILKLGREMLKSFYTSEEFADQCKKYGDYMKMMENLDYNIEIKLNGEKM